MVLKNVQLWIGAAVAVMLSLPVNAQQVYDDFSSYANGTIHTQIGTPTGLSETWEDLFLAGTIAAGDLLVEDPVGGYTFARALAGSASLFFPTDGSSFYFAMTFTVLNAAPFQFTVSSRHAGGGTPWDIGVQNNNFFVNGQAAAGTVTLGQEYTVISRLTRNDAGNDSVVLWVDPASEGDAPLISGSGNYVDAGRQTFTNVTFTVAEFGTMQAQVSSISGGTSFADVVASPIPEPSTFSLLMLSGLAFFGMRRKLRR